MSPRPMIAGLMLLVFSAPAYGGDDPAIQGEARKAIQSAMKTHVDQMQVEGVYYIYDPVTDSVLELTFKELHAGIMKKGAFFVSCADFSSGDTLYDLDLLVAEKNGVFKVVDVIVHKAGDQKRDYLSGK
ncbi:MAG: hypothetical protein L0Z51_04085 [Candidatus Latescibacteria bacterium]|nr:hypothetical protein [Candidatus Latescibacterota bacterium]